MELYRFWFVSCRCYDIFNPEEQRILKKYRKENFKEKDLKYSERRAIGKCPLTPEEVQLLRCCCSLHFMSFILVNAKSWFLIQNVAFPSYVYPFIMVNAVAWKLILNITNIFAFIQICNFLILLVMLIALLHACHSSWSML